MLTPHLIKSLFNTCAGFLISQDNSRVFPCLQKNSVSELITRILTHYNTVILTNYNTVAAILSLIVLCPPDFLGR